MSKYNKLRTERMKQKSNAELEKIMKSGSLSAAAAEYELRRRKKD